MCPWRSTIRRQAAEALDNFVNGGSGEVLDPVPGLQGQLGERCSALCIAGVRKVHLKAWCAVRWM